ncbi:MAG: carboxypeptidase-like regulatory domain-containing protein, partial [Balneolaceae bacterium]|nr:carboxypeptidase-like regulatory domain-containing protein [Balneolaceae bacterium]
MTTQVQHTLATVFALLLVLSFAPRSAAAQKVNSTKGKISGTVVDAQNGETVIGANVVITGTGIGDATDIDGTYTISALDPGTYSVTVTYVSYTKTTISGVKVDAGGVTTLNVQLEPQTLGLDEITVMADAATNSEAGLLAMQRKSIAVQDGLSSEYLTKTGDGNVASAIKRVTGVTLLNGKDIFVRGLGNRYSNVQLNGAQIPSTNPNKKEAPVDLVSSGLVDNIVVQKTFTPDQPGEFSGGSVQ